MRDPVEARGKSPGMVGYPAKSGVKLVDDDA